MSLLRRACLLCGLTLMAFLLGACGGGGSGGNGSVVRDPTGANYTVNVDINSGGNIKPTVATVAKNQTTSFTITPATGYTISSTSGCNGSLVGTIYTTGPVIGDCTVTVRFAAQNTNATSQWTWMSGTNSFTSYGVYGTKGVAAASNSPGPRFEAMSWTGTNGVFWLFGGSGTDASGNVGQLNDLWRYDPNTNEWTWVAGSNSANAPGVYGTKGVETAGNNPGARIGGTTWVDANGNLWLFGGQAYDVNSHNAIINDLWMFDTAADEWVWEGGSDTYQAAGVYGTLGTPSTTNIPGARVNATAWVDASGKFWLFGGYGTDSGGTSINYLNDLWQFDPATSQWTWMGGSDVDTPVVAGNYGTKGVAASTNNPGGREAAVGWADSNGNLWLFGGYIGGPLMNDLWSYNIATNEWTWQTGSDTNNTSGVYGTQGVAATTNTPGGREWVLSHWVDSNGQLWMFGGYGNASSNSAGYLNDLWRFDPVNKVWTWVGGSDTAGAYGVYGSQGVVTTGATPGGRESEATWMDQNGDLWLFGGNGLSDSTVSGSNKVAGNLNDLWKYTP